jgi:3-isopropylmalate dehydrogenase
MRALIAVLAGDGIGPEVTDEAVRALGSVARRFGHEFRFESALLGGAAIDATGVALPEDTLALCRRADGVLMGAVGGPRWSDPNATVRPEQGLLRLRKELGLFANLRPVAPHPAVLGASPIKPELLAGVDILVVRELTGGIYFGDKRRSDTDAVDVCRYTVAEIERVVRLARGGASSPRSTRRTCSRPRGCGARSSSGSPPRNSPISRSSTCWSTRPRCTCCAGRATST